MPVPCIVAFCERRGTHIFPTDEPRRTQWILSIEYKKPGVTLGKHSRICSDHFRPTDFKITPLALLQPDLFPRILTKTAIPSIFPWKPPEIQEVKESSPDEDSPRFNVSNAKVTYSRGLPICFVEEQPYISNPVESDFDDDPLKLSVEASDFNEQISHNADIEESNAEELEIFHLRQMPMRA